MVASVSFVAERIGINGNSCYKTHCFLNTNLTIIGKVGNSGQKRDEHGRRKVYLPLWAEIQ